MAVAAKEAVENSQKIRRGQIERQTRITENMRADALRRLQLEIDEHLMEETADGGTTISFFDLGDETEEQIRIWMKDEVLKERLFDLYREAGWQVWVEEMPGRTKAFGFKAK